MTMNPPSGRIRITGPDWDRLCSHLLRDDGVEHAAFLLAGIHRSSDAVELLVRETVPIDDRQLIGGPQAVYLEIEPEALVAVVNRAIREELALVEVHSHPGGVLGGRFSAADELGFREILPYMFSSLKVPVYAALVLGGPDEFEGAIWMDSPSNRRMIESINVVGPERFVRFNASTEPSIRRLNPTDDHLGQFDRQVRAFGREGQLILGELKIAVVGLGGLGSIIVRQLARIGVRRFVIVDDDAVETTNLNRLDGGLIADALCNVPKTAVAARSILEANPAADVVVHRLSAFHTNAMRDIATCDLIVGGTDNVGSRFALNDVALAYLRPYLDIATEIHTDGYNLIHIGGRYTFTFPGTGCILCSRAIDAAEAAAEFIPQVVKDRNRRDGYISESEEPAPSVMPLNSVVASLAILEVLMWATGVRPVIPQVLFDGLAGSATKVCFEQNPECDRCAELLGRGDLAELSSKYNRWAA